MLFSEFVSLCDLLKDAEQLIEAADTVEWDPDSTAEFKGMRGVTGEVGAKRSAPQATARVAVKTGDFVFVPDSSGKHTATVVTAMDDNDIMVLNPLRSIKSKLPISALMRDPGLGRRLTAKHKGRSSWVYNPKLAVPL
jgi:hypothetical protein